MSLHTSQFSYKLEKFNSYEHPFHLVKASPWPFYTALPLFIILLSTVKYFHHYSFSSIFLISALVIFFGSIIHWFWDIIVEATYEGQHTSYVRRGLRLGFALFILSEIMFFFSFFWAFFHYSVSPSVWIGNTWPPLGLLVISPWGLPLLNTIILLSSGVTVTWAHKAILTLQTEQIIKKFNYLFDEQLNGYVLNLHANSNSNQAFLTSVFGLSYFLDSQTHETYKSLINSPSAVVLLSPSTFTNLIFSLKRREVIVALAATIFYGVLFTMLQLHEYKAAPFAINDSVYGSIFYLTTGFHGFHVLIGTLFLAICLIRHIYYHFNAHIHVGFEMAIWYWHFVDVVWLFLFICIYWWGS